MATLEIKCPQPTRSLKRQAAEIDDANDLLHGHSPPKKQKKQKIEKKQNLYSSLSSFDRWLSELPIPFHRISNHSDSFFTFNMNHERRGSRAQSDPPPLLRPASANQDVHQPLFPPSLSNPRVVALRDSQTPSSWTHNTSITPSTSSKSKSSSRVTHPRYRKELKNHGVYIDSYGMTMPDTVRDYAQNILDKNLSSSGMTEEETLFAQKCLSALDDADEAVTRMGFTAISLFPNPVIYDNAIVVGGNIPFDNKALPFTSGYGFKPIVTPKPDLHYGYSSQNFDHSETMLMEQNRLSPYAAPNSANFWPFFAVEFKSPSRGGTDWAAENQNAGVGAHSVNSIEILMNYTKDTKNRRITDSVFFSCVVDVSHATLWVHWKTVENDPKFVSGEMNHYRFKKAADLRAFRSDIRNIIDHGINERLTMIKNALKDILPLVSEWEQEERTSKVRKRASTLSQDQSSEDELANIDSDPPVQTLRYGDDA